MVLLGVSKATKPCPSWMREWTDVTLRDGRAVQVSQPWMQQ